MKLHHFSRSSASLRVRIALAIKGISYEQECVSLALAEHLLPDYGRMHPQNLVPMLLLGDGKMMVQSLPIIEFLEECYPVPALLPPDSYGRYYVRAIAQMIACEVHPLNNMRVVRHLRDSLNVDQISIDREWSPHWLSTGFRAIEAFLEREGLHGRFCAGDHFTLADICLFSQVFSAARFGFSVAPYPLLAGIAERISILDAVRLAQLNVE